MLQSSEHLLWTCYLRSMSSCVGDSRIRCSIPGRVLGKKSRGAESLPRVLLMQQKFLGCKPIAGSFVSLIHSSPKRFSTGLLSIHPQPCCVCTWDCSDPCTGPCSWPWWVWSLHWAAFKPVRSLWMASRWHLDSHASMCAIRNSWKISDTAAEWTVSRQIVLKRKLMLSGLVEPATHIWAVQCNIWIQLSAERALISGADINLWLNWFFKHCQSSPALGCQVPLQDPTKAGTKHQ